MKWCSVCLCLIFFCYSYGFHFDYERYDDIDSNYFDDNMSFSEIMAVVDHKIQIDPNHTFMNTPSIFPTEDEIPKKNVYIPTASTTVKNGLPVVETTQDSLHTSLPALPSKTTEKQITKDLPPGYHYLDRRRDIIKSLSAKHQEALGRSGSTVHTTLGISWMVVFFYCFYNVVYMN